MRLLLDECVDQRLRWELHEHDVKTVADMGWSALTDGELLDQAQHAFDVCITVDRNVPYQQHLPTFDLVLVLRARTNRLIDLQPLVPALLAALPAAPARKATVMHS